MICSKDTVGLENVNFTPSDNEEDASPKKNTMPPLLEIGKLLLEYSREGFSAGVIDLLSKGAPITTDWLGTSPLHLAVINNHYETCEVLIRAGVGKDGRTKVDRTPLHFAAYEGHYRIAKLLLDYGAEVDCRDMLHMTPLHWAVERHHVECVHVLLSYGARYDAVSRFNKTPLSIALEFGWIDMAEILQKGYSLDTTKTLEAIMNRDSLPQDIADGNRIQNTKKKILSPGDKSSTKFNLNYDDELSDKSINNSNSEIEMDNIEKDPQTVLASLLPQVEDVPSEATLQFLKEHGITMLPADSTNTVNSAFQSGRRIVLSDAGKLVLNDVNSQKEEKKISKKSQIILPSTKLKNYHLLTMMPSQSKPNILQKIPMDTLKKVTSGGNVNFIQLPKHTKVSPVTKNVKLLNVPVKTVPNLTIVKKVDGCIPVTSNSPLKSDIKIEQSNNIKNTKIIELKNVSPTVKVLLKKKPNGDIQNLDLKTDLCNKNNTLDDSTHFTNNSLPMIDESPSIEDKSTQIDKLKSELQQVKSELEFYKRKFQESQTELSLYKKKSTCHSLMDAT